MLSVARCRTGHVIALAAALASFEASAQALNGPLPDLSTPAARADCQVRLDCRTRVALAFVERGHAPADLGAGGPALVALALYLDGQTQTLPQIFDVAADRFRVDLVGHFWNLIATIDAHDGPAAAAAALAALRGRVPERERGGPRPFVDSFDWQVGDALVRRFAETQGHDRAMALLDAVTAAGIRVTDDHRAILMHNRETVRAAAAGLDAADLAADSRFDLGLLGQLAASGHGPARAALLDRLGRTLDARGAELILVNAFLNVGAADQALAILPDAIDAATGGDGRLDRIAALALRDIMRAVARLEAGDAAAFADLVLPLTLDAEAAAIAEDGSLGPWRRGDPALSWDLFEAGLLALALQN